MAATILTWNQESKPPVLFLKYLDMFVRWGMFVIYLQLFCGPLDHLLWWDCTALSLLHLSPAFLQFPRKPSKASQLVLSFG